MKKENLIALLRITFGWIFLWAFLDKLFGLGFATTADKSWLAGGSPTSGFLANAVKGPFVEVFHSMAGSPVVDWLFMLGLLGLGVALMLGVALRFAGYAGALLMFLMWIALVPSSNNPIVDDHVIYFFLFLILPHLKAGHTFGIGKWWDSTELVRKNQWLE